MNCARIQLSAATTVIFIRDGWLYIEVADVDALRGQLSSVDGSRLLSVAEVSERTGFTHGAVRGWIKRGLLNAMKVGKSYRMREADLQSFLDGPMRVDAPYRRTGRRRKPICV